MCSKPSKVLEFFEMFQSRECLHSPILPISPSFFLQSITRTLIGIILMFLLCHTGKVRLKLPSLVIFQNDISNDRLRDPAF